MASTDIINDWIPIEWDSEVITRINLESAVERYGRPHPMRSSTKRVLRSGGLTVTAGTSYTTDASTNDYITLTARRLMAQFIVDEDDLADADSVVDTLSVKGMDWAISYADSFDNACLAVSAAENGTTVPFTSLYKALRTTNSATSYTADDNYLTWDDDLTSIAAPAVVQEGRDGQVLVARRPARHRRSRLAGRAPYRHGQPGLPDLRRQHGPR